MSISLQDFIVLEDVATVTKFSHHFKHYPVQGGADRTRSTARGFVQYALLQENPSEEEFGEARLLAYLRNHRASSLPTLAASTLQTLQQ